MTYSIVPIATQNYILVVHVGALRRRELDQAWQIAIADLQLKQWTRLLVDIRAVMNSLPSSEIYDFISQLRDNLPRGTRIALVVREDQHNDGRFIENVARNRTIKLQYFMHMQPAVGWLICEDAKQKISGNG